ncbi:hypothetical protein AAFF_G00390910 [Aldrovandia affinis]|uniref:DUF4587 domain-containing protein n=1 Tax=Aldrovandia affinis TaxID=143900 RepID=A0AAD7VY64_9TELE|nr:hypothetical protein AAFF_G00390910 [Aldrovandia affinis]
MAEDNYAQTQQLNPDPQNVQIIQQPAFQQPTTIFQQIPSATASPAPSIRPGHVREDLVELMMIQNAQMHQVIMNNMTMSALSTFGYAQTTPTQEPVRYPLIMEEEDLEVYHHHYPPVSFPLPHLDAPTPPPPPPTPCLPSSTRTQWTTPNQHPPLAETGGRSPPPPSATRTVGADIPPATEYYDATDRRL